VEPIAAPELAMVEPAHHGIAPLDIGAVISGLTPALSSSVEPSGIVPPFNVKFEFAVVGESGEAVPLDVALLADALVDAQVEVIVEPNPPPSKTEPATGIEAIPDPLDPVMPEDIPEYAADPLMVQFETGAGLKPPGSISVAPSGIPVALFDPLDALEPSTPSGEVAPNPGTVITLCACAAPQPSRTTAAMRDKILMKSASLRESRPPHETFRGGRELEANNF
jgi:hypothetical protein